MCRFAKAAPLLRKPKTPQRDFDGAAAQPRPEPVGRCDVSGIQTPRLSQGAAGEEPSMRVVRGRRWSGASLLGRALVLWGGGVGRAPFLSTKGEIADPLKLGCRRFLYR